MRDQQRTGDQQKTNDADSLSAAHHDAVSAPDVQPVKTCPKRAWIEIVLEDDAGKRVPDEEYLIIAPDQAGHSGYLDAEGFARVDDLDPGQCQVSFPRLDRREWRPK
jgi:hypothetical protein